MLLILVKSLSVAHVSESLGYVIPGKADAVDKYPYMSRPPPKPSGPKPPDLWLKLIKTPAISTTDPFVSPKLGRIDDKAKVAEHQNNLRDMLDLFDIEDETYHSSYPCWNARRICGPVNWASSTVSRTASSSINEHIRSANSHTVPAHSATN